MADFLQLNFILHPQVAASIKFKAHREEYSVRKTYASLQVLTINHMIGRSF